VTPDRFRVVPAAYVMLLRGEDVLLQRREGTGYMDGLWACAAAGHVEAGETVHQAAVREAAEELGITIDPADLEPVTSLHRTGANGHAIDERVDWFFCCRTWAGEPTVQEPDKTAGLRWFPLTRLPDELVPHERHVLTGWRDGTLRIVETFGFEQEQADAQARAALGVAPGAAD
jgi:8-oxo-dGTP pyrophosphatase MutT (NUDIX family)